MAIIEAPALPQNLVNVSQLGGQWRNWDSNFPFAQFVSSSQQPIDIVTVGDSSYPLIYTHVARFEPPVFGSSGRFLVSGLESEFIGRGNTLAEAKRDWELALDTAIQSLLGTEDFERSPSQQTTWNLLSRHFDLNAIRYSQPMHLRTYGRVLRRRDGVFQIRWIDGSTDKLWREAVPAEVAGYCEGQPFEAVVARDSRTWELKSIVAAFRTSELPTISDEDVETYFGRDKVRELPTLGWDD